MKISLFLFVFFSAITIFAQREDHTWYFSDTNLGLFFDYNTNVVSITHDHAPMNYAGSYAVACNNLTGQLMFYTDGDKIWDKNHLIMPNGSGLTNGDHPTQTGRICYYPGHPNHLFIFNTTSDGAFAGNIYYSEIDLLLPGNGSVSNPSGNVISSAKNIFLTNQSTEGMKIIAGTGNLYWLIIPQINSTNVRVFKIDINGVTLYNTYNIGINVGTISHTEYSPISHKIAIANMNGSQSSIVMDFNETTGQISNSIAISGTSFYGSGIGDVEWSPSGQLLYLTRYRNSSSSSSGQLLQYNINTPSSAAIVIATMLPSSNSNISRGLKLAPDGKIYHAWGANSNTYLGTVNNPDNVGTACNYNPLSLNLEQPINYLHTFSEPLLPLSCNNITVNDTTICSGQSATLTATGATSYSWSNGLDTNSQQIVSPTSTTYYIVTGITGTCVSTDTATVNVIPNPTPSITGNLTVCLGDATVLNASSGYSTYLWTGGSTSQAINVFSTGTYIVTVTNSYGCKGIATANVTVNPKPILTFSNDTTINKGDSVQLEVTGASFYLWNPIVGLSCITCNNPVATPNSSIVYCVVGTNAYGCSDTVCVNITIENECGNIWVPSAFSPNGDKENDVLYVYGKCIKIMEFRIFNRWGEKVFESTDPTVGWNGVFRGKDADTDVFVYYLKAEENDGSKVELKGSITLMR